ncbi:MAG: PBP1A family penicillin-binding protein [Candidatus Margulisbacteria bacterium]|nr:PBP1A family penicillin-binding protein [Candidatus Margulisiibacteriota bacterium]
MIFRSKRAIGKISRSSSSKRFGAQQNRLGGFKRFLMGCLKLGIIGAGVGALLVGAVVIYFTRQLPDIESISTYIPAETTKIYSADGVILAELHQEENRIRIPIDDISKTLQKTVIAMEDTDFYKHNGINIKGIMRALYRDIIAMAFVEGGSTLTQQLARNLFLEKQKKIERKIKEILMAIEIERKYTKVEILELYLNQVYWGHNAYGIESASQMYFGKKSKHLTLAEAAGLVGMLKGPELFSPFRYFDRFKRRQRVVLKRMEVLGIITAQQVEDAYNEKVSLASRKRHRYKAGFFSSYVVDQLIEMYGEETLYTSGMKVYTTLNYKLQQHAEAVVKKYMDYGKQVFVLKGERYPSLNYTEASLIAVDPRNGHVIAMQGGVDFSESQFNRTVQAHRQPGSAFKPFVYLAAFDKGFSPGSIVSDMPVTFNTIEGPYSPQNYSLKFSGNLPIRRAFEKSVNVVAVKLNDLVGPSTVVSMAKKAGIQSNLTPVLSLPLGANEVSMIELVQSYMVFANYGKKVAPVSILRIEDRNGVPLYNHRFKETQVLDENLVVTLVDTMRGIVDYGTGRGAKLPRPVAGKTGTTSDYKDAWFFGFVPQMVCATWVGNDDNQPMNRVTGGWVPAQMWKAFMKEALVGVPAQDFKYPRGMVKRRVNWDTKMLASADTPDDAKVTIEKYWVGTEPKVFDTLDMIEKAKRQAKRKLEEDGLVNDFFAM